MENTQPRVTKPDEVRTKEPVSVLTPKPPKSVPSAMSAMATLFQRWSEKCEQASGDELTPELQWFLKGAAFAFGWDAQRARSLADPLEAKNPPPGNLGMAKALEIMVNMLCSMGVINTPEEDTMPGGAV